METRRIDALEGLRGVAVALVVLCHADIPGLGGAGWVGVNTFFVISGFIITYLLVREQEGRGGIALPAFFARRAIRRNSSRHTCSNQSRICARTSGGEMPNLGSHS